MELASPVPWGIGAWSNKSRARIILRAHPWTILLMPWAGPAAWRSWRDTGWAPDPGGYYGHTGSDGHKGGRLLQDRFPGSARGDAGISATPHHIYCGGECVGVQLGDGGDSKRGGAWLACKGG